MHAHCFCYACERVYWISLGAHELAVRFETDAELCHHQAEEKWSINYFLPIQVLLVNW